MAAAGDATPQHLFSLLGLSAVATPDKSTKLAMKLDMTGDVDLHFSEELFKAISQVTESKDATEQAELSPLDFINRVFPDEESLSKLDEELQKMKKKIHRIDEEIIESVGRQSRAGIKGKQELGRAQTTSVELFSKLKEMQMKAEESERIVAEICRPISDLDYAKKNLSRTTTALRKIAAATTGIDKIRTLAEKKQYKEASVTIVEVVDILEYFKDHKKVDKIAELNKKMDLLRADLKKMIFFEFDYLGNPLEIQEETIKVLSNACFAIGALGDEMKKEFVAFFSTRQLAMYWKDFKDGMESASLDNTKLRYAWLLQYLKSYDQVFTRVFPPGWRVNESVVEEFCFQTREKLIELMEGSKATLNVASLKKALKQTIMFERELILFFSKAQGPGVSKSGTKKLHDAHRQQHGDYEENAFDDSRFQGVHIPPEMMRFKGMISIAFDAYMYLYIQHQEKLMHEMFNQIIAAETWLTDDVSQMKVLNSSTDMIFYFGKTRERMASLNQNQAFFDLFKLFQKFLRLYAQELQAKINTLVPAQFTEETEKTCCLIMNTADYCSKMSARIEDTVQGEISDKFREQVNLSAEQDAYQGVLASAVGTLTKYMEFRMESAFAHMHAIRWDILDNIGDVSKYVGMIAALLQEKFPFYRNWINLDYWTYFCDTFVGWFITKYQSAIYDCKKINEIGAEQLIVDSTQLKTIVEQLPVLGRPGESPPDRYMKRVRREFEEIDKVVKMLLAPMDGFVDTFKSLYFDNHSDKGLARLMALKGFAYNDQLAMLQMYGSNQSSVITVGGGMTDRLGSLFDLELDTTAAAARFKSFFNM